MVADFKTTVNRFHGGGGGIERKLECWYCGGEHMKRNFPKCAKETEEEKRVTAASTINALR